MDHSSRHHLFIHEGLKPNSGKKRKPKWIWQKKLSLCFNIPTRKRCRMLKPPRNSMSVMLHPADIKNIRCFPFQQHPGLLTLPILPNLALPLGMGILTQMKDVGYPLLKFLPSGPVVVFVCNLSCNPQVDTEFKFWKKQKWEQRIMGGWFSGQPGGSKVLPFNTAFEIDQPNKTKSTQFEWSQAIRMYLEDLVNGMNSCTF